MQDMLSSISDWVLTVLTGAVVWFFKELSKKQSIADAKEMEARLTARIEEQSRIIEKQQTFIYENVATKKDIDDLKADFKELSSKFDDFVLNMARGRNGVKRHKE